MRLRILLVFTVVMFGLAIVGFVWMVILAVPICSLAGAYYFANSRSHRRRENHAAAIQREAQRTRLLNEQELRAWQSSIENEGRTSSNSKEVLKKFDSARDDEQ